MVVLLSGCVSLTNETPSVVPPTPNNRYEIAVLVEAGELVLGVEKPRVVVGGQEHVMTHVSGGRWKHDHVVQPGTTSFTYEFKADYLLRDIWPIILLTNRGTAHLGPEQTRIETPPLLFGSGTSAGYVNLSWNYTWPGLLASSSDGYYVEESIISASSGFAQIAFVPRSSGSALSLTRAAGTYWYRVRAYNDILRSHSAWSNVVSVAIQQSGTRLLRVFNNLAAGGGDQVLRARIASTETAVYSNAGTEQLEPDAYCGTLPGRSIGPGQAMVFDVTPFATPYHVFLGLGLWQFDQPGCADRWMKKNWTVDSTFQPLWIWTYVNIQQSPGTVDADIEYDSQGNIVLRVLNTTIPFYATTYDPVQ